MHLTYISGQKVLDIGRVNQPFLGEKMDLTRISSQKVLDNEKAKQSFPSHKKSQKVNNIETIYSKVTISSKDQKINNPHSRIVNVMKTCTSHIVKLFAKARAAKNLLGQKFTPVE